MPFAVQVPIGFALHAPVDRRRDANPAAALPHKFNKVVVIVAFVGDQSVASETVNQSERLRFVVPFAARQDKPQRIAKSVNGDVNLGRVSAA